MNDDIERRLRRVTPRGAPPELRSRVFAALSAQLHDATPRSSRRRFHPALAVGVGLLGSLALNVWVTDSLDRRLAIVLGPPLVPKQAAEIAADVASLTDAATGRWAYERLVAGRLHDDDTRPYAVRLRQMIQQYLVDLKETPNEATHQNPQMDRDRHGNRDHRPVDSQCVLRVEHRNTA